MQQIKMSHHVPSCKRIKNETLLRSFSLIVIFNFRFALIAVQLLPVNPLPPVNQLAIFLQINWLSNCLQTLFWRSRTSANMMINQPKIKTENLSYSDFFFLLTNSTLNYEENGGHNNKVVSIRSNMCPLFHIFKPQRTSLLFLSSWSNHWDWQFKT